MPLLHWNVYDFIGCLSVEPTIEEYETRYAFEIRRHGAFLRINVWQYESTVHLAIGLESNLDSLIEFALFVRDQAILIQDGNDEWLELRDCVMGASRFSSYRELGDAFDPKRYPIGQRIRIGVEPRIQVEFMRDRD